MKKIITMTVMMVLMITLVGCGKSETEQPEQVIPEVEAVAVNPVKAKIQDKTWTGQAALTITREEGVPINATASFEVTFFDKTVKEVFQWCEIDEAGELNCYEENEVIYPSWELEGNVIKATDETGAVVVFEYREDDFGNLVWRNLDGLKKSASDQGWGYDAPAEIALNLEE